MNKKSSNLSKYLDGIQNFSEFGNDDKKREEFLRELYKVPNVEEKFREQLTEEWRYLAENVKPKFFLEKSSAYKGKENAVRLYIYNIISDPTPVIKVEKELEG